MKRGRKDVFTQNGCVMLKKLFEGDGNTKRTLQARYYQVCVQGLLTEAASEFPILKRIFFLDKVNQTIVWKREILEQLGRMLNQDGYPREDVITVARAAAEMLADGWQVKTIKRYILKGRTTGEW